MSPHGPVLLRVTAGTDTSRITLSIMIGLVVEHPHVQKKLHQELDDVLGTRTIWVAHNCFVFNRPVSFYMYVCWWTMHMTRAGDSGRVTLKLKDQLTYTSAVVHEALRVKTVAPIGVPHMTTRDTSLGEKLVHLLHMAHMCLWEIADGYHPAF